MKNSNVPIEIPEDLGRGLEVHAAAAGKTPSMVVIEALEKFGVERLSEDEIGKKINGSQ